MKMLIACIFVHFVLVQWVSPWWVPNLTLVACLVAVCERPARWWLFAAVAGLAMTLWSVRHPTWIVGSFLMFSGLAMFGARHWNLQDVRVQIMVVAASMFVFIAMLLWIEHIPLWSVGGACFVWWSLSVISVLGIRFVMDSCRVSSS